MFVALNNPEHATTYQPPWPTDRVPQSYMWALQKEPIESILSHMVEIKCPFHCNTEMVYSYVVVIILRRCFDFLKHWTLDSRFYWDNHSIDNIKYLICHTYFQTIRLSPDRKDIIIIKCSINNNNIVYGCCLYNILLAVGFKYIYQTKYIYHTEKKILLKNHYFTAAMKWQWFIVYLSIIRGKIIPCYSPWSLSCHVLLPAAGEFGEG